MNQVQQCVDTYVTENPTGSSLDTQAQDMVVNLDSVINRVMTLFGNEP